MIDQTNTHSIFSLFEHDISFTQEQQNNNNNILDLCRTCEHILGRSLVSPFSSAANRIQQASQLSDLSD